MAFFPWRITVKNLATMKLEYLSLCKVGMQNILDGIALCSITRNKCCAVNLLSAYNARATRSPSSVQNVTASFPRILTRICLGGASFGFFLSGVLNICKSFLMFVALPN